MKVVNMRLSTGSNKIRGYFDVETQEGITIKGFKIAEGSTGLFIGVPSEQDRNDRTKWWDRVLMSKELKDQITEVALQEYGNIKGSSSAPSAGASTSDPF